MTLDDLYQEWAVDSEISQTDLNSSSFSTYQLHSKYLKHLSTARREHRFLETEMSKLRHVKTQYYLGELPLEILKHYKWLPFPKRILKTDISSYMEADEDIITLTLKVAGSAETVFFLDTVVKAITNRGFTIKNIIEWTKLQNGGY